MTRRSERKFRQRFRREARRGRNVAVYLDANIYDCAVKHGWSGAIRATASSRCTVIYGSVELLIEALRCPHARLRRQLIESTLNGSQQHLAPALRRTTTELASEIRRAHPEWLRRPVDRSGHDRAMGQARRLWQRLGRDSNFIPSGLRDHEAFLEGLLVEGREAQKARRAAARAGAEFDVLALLGDARNELGDRAQALPRAERYSRVMGGALWWDALRGDPALVDMSTWLSGSLKPAGEISHVDWMHFWCVEVQLSSIPSHVIYLLTELHQIDEGIELSKSNAMDAVHAMYLFDVDALVTRDMNFAKVLAGVQADAPFDFAKTVLLDDRITPGRLAFDQALAEAARPRSRQVTKRE